MRLVKSFLVGLLVCFSCLNALAQPIPKLPTDNKQYRFVDLPGDQKPHWKLGGEEYYTWEVTVGLKLTIGKGIGRSPQEADNDASNEMAKIGIEQLNDFSSFGVYASVRKTKRSGGLVRNILIFLGTIPSEGQSRVGSVSLQTNEANFLLDRIDDLLKTGRKWRDLGTPTKSKRIDLDPLTTEFGQPLGFSIEEAQGVYGQNWYVYSKRVCFASTNLRDLSQLRDDVKRAIDWLDKFSETDKISPPK